MGKKNYVEVKITSDFYFQNDKFFITELYFV